MMNIAYGHKAKKGINLLSSTPSQAVSPTLKAKLPEANQLATPIYRYHHYRDGMINVLLNFCQRFSKIANITQSKRIRTNIENLPAKGDVRVVSVTVGLPKGINTYGSGAAIIPAMSPRMNQTLYVKTNILRKERAAVNNLLSAGNYSTGSATPRGNVITKLSNLRVRSLLKRDLLIDRNLMSLLCNPELLMLAYDNIKSKPGNMTQGVVPETLDGINLEWFIEISKQLSTEQFNFKPSRRINIPKASGGKRPLSIAPPRDKIVQEGIKMILEAIYEPIFLDCSHGFRPHRSCHSALKDFRTNFQLTQWIIEGDISKCFDSIDHHKLMTLIETKITDRKFTRLIWKSLKAGYFEFRIYHNNLAGTPQGSIVSPILANIFLHQLDEHIMNLKGEFDKGTKPRRDPAARSLEGKIARAKKKGDFNLVRSLSLEARKIPHMLFNDDSFRRLKYIRYADDWIIGVRGTLKETELILENVKIYCETIGLEISETKTKLTNLQKSKALFLGTELSRSNVRKYSRVSSSSSTKRLPLGLRLTVPLLRIMQKLSQAGFLKNGVPSPKFLWLHNTHDQIVHLYNSVFRGFINYYSPYGLVHNYPRLVSLLNNVLKQSCAKLLASKFSLNSRAKAFKKFGPQLNSPSGVQLIKPSYKSDIYNFKIHKHYENITGLYSQSKSIATLFNLACRSCGSYYRVEMHHVRAMKDLNPKVSHIDRLMVKSNRKQIPLCRKCHMIKHKSPTLVPSH
jgi:group II intron reverse transcriptase/maturase